VVDRESTLEKMVTLFQNHFEGARVLITGNTGFKGSWLSLWLHSMGAQVFGYSLAPNTTPNLFSVLRLESLVNESSFNNILDLVALKAAIQNASPDIVIHMAAQAFVRYSYQNPVETYGTNVMGTVHALESTRTIESVRATVVVTTDKCYENREREAGYREDEAMGGFDPYSSSKGCAELVSSAYRQSYFSKSANHLASARAGNVIGGGDWSDDRLIPDAIKAFEANEPLMIRNPMATRPWQHVLEPLSGYLVLAQALYEQGTAFASAWNFGPRDEDNRSVREVIDLLISSWSSSARWEKEGLEQPHEANLLKLDCSKARSQLDWTPKWSLEIAVQKIVEWQKAYQQKQNMREVSLAQINQYNDA
jgi:CDP-glucose 4,6-dehydratase